MGVHMFCSCRLPDSWWSIWVLGCGSTRLPAGQLRQLLLGDRRPSGSIGDRGRVVEIRGAAFRDAMACASPKNDLPRSDGPFKSENLEGVLTTPCQ